MYEGSYKNGKQDGHGTLTARFGNIFVGEFMNGKLWNTTEYDKNGNIHSKTINGEKQPRIP